MTDASTSGIPEIPDVVLFTVAKRPVTATQIVEQAMSHDDLARLRGEVARGQAARGQREADDTIRRDLERGFRYQRALVSAEEMERWLGGWDLEVTAWRAQLRREAALQGRHGRDAALDALAAEVEVDPEMWWAALICTGVLERAATVTAQQMATTVALGDAPEAASAEHLDRWMAAAAPETHIDRELQERALDWLHLRWVELQADDIDAAREARRCLDDDGLSPDRVAALLGHPAHSRAGWLHTAHEDLREPLLAAEVGATSSPVESDPGFRLVKVLDRRRPEASDAEVRLAVRTRLAEQALDLEVRDRVQWHVDF